MMPLLSSVADPVTGQGASVADPSLWTQFGPFAICFVLLGMFIVWREWQIKKDNGATEADRARERKEYDERIAGLVKALEDTQQRERDLYDRVAGQTAQLAPVLDQALSTLTEASTVITRGTHALDRLEGPS